MHTDALSPNPTTTTHAPRTLRHEYHPRLLEIFRHREVLSQRFTEEREYRVLFAQEHNFAFSSRACSDGRKSDLTFALGLRAGQHKSFRDPGSIEATFEDPVFMQRFVAHHKLVSRGLDLVSKELGQIDLSIAHESGRFKLLGCGAWDNRTAEYLQHMRNLAAEVNAWQNGQIVSITALLDTDDDSIRIFGPSGQSLSTTAYASETNDSSPGRLQRIQSELELELIKLFPFDLEPICSLRQSLRDAFHHELAERLVGNILFVEAVRRNDRPIEALDHQECAIFLGRPLETVNHNEAFLIEDRGNIFGDGLSHLKLGLKYVTPNCILADPENWVVPVFIAIPHNGGDANVVRQYARGLRKKVERCVQKNAAWVAEHIHGKEHLPKQAVARITSELSQRVVICTTIHDRKDRFPVSVDDLESIR